MKLKSFSYFSLIIPLRPRYQSSYCNFSQGHLTGILISNLSKIKLVSFLHIPDIPDDELSVWKGQSGSC